MPSDRADFKPHTRVLTIAPCRKVKGICGRVDGLWSQYGLKALRLRKIYLDTLDTNLRNNPS
jgi:hypothetical protein